jgi:hypothetical protein
MAYRPNARSWDRDKYAEVRRFRLDGYSPSWIAEKVALPLGTVELWCDAMAKGHSTGISAGVIPEPIPVDEELAERIAAVRVEKLRAKRAEHPQAVVGPPIVHGWGGKRRK